MPRQWKPKDLRYSIQEFLDRPFDPEQQAQMRQYWGMSPALPKEDAIRYRHILSILNNEMPKLVRHDQVQQYKQFLEAVGRLSTNKLSNELYKKPQDEQDKLWHHKKKVSDVSTIEPACDVLATAIGVIGEFAGSRLPDHITGKYQSLDSAMVPMMKDLNVLADKAQDQMDKWEKEVERQQKNHRQ